jgi:hypothetical protein
VRPGYVQRRGRVGRSFELAADGPQLPEGEFEATSAKQPAPTAPAAFSQSARALASKLADHLGDARVVGLEPVALDEYGLDRAAELGAP